MRALSYFPKVPQQLHNHNTAPSPLLISVWLFSSADGQKEDVSSECLQTVKTADEQGENNCTSLLSSRKWRSSQVQRCGGSELRLRSWSGASSLSRAGSAAWLSGCWTEGGRRGGGCTDAAKETKRPLTAAAANSRRRQSWEDWRKNWITPFFGCSKVLPLKHRQVFMNYPAQMQKAHNSEAPDSLKAHWSQSMSTLPAVCWKAHSAPGQAAAIQVTVDPTPDETFNTGCFSVGADPPLWQDVLHLQCITWKSRCVALNGSLTGNTVKINVLNSQTVNEWNSSCPHTLSIAAVELNFFSTDVMWRQTAETWRLWTDLEEKHTLRLRRKSLVSINTHASRQRCCSSAFDREHRPPTLTNFSEKLLRP